jgi:hypothetical protein
VEAAGDTLGLAPVAAAACLRARFALGEAAGEAATEGDAAVSAAEAVVSVFLCERRFVGACSGDWPGLGESHDSDESANFCKHSREGKDLGG